MNIQTYSMAGFNTENKRVFRAISSGKRNFYKKVCVMGGRQVGKTSLMRRYTNNVFNENIVGVTGAHLFTKSVVRSHFTLNLYFWELSGFSAQNIPAEMMRGAAAGMIVCDMTNHASLDEIEPLTQRWRSIHPTRPLILVANKVDEVERFNNNIITAIQQAQALELPITFTSPKTGQGILNSFELVLLELVPLKSTV